MAQVLKGAPVAAAITQEVAARADALRAAGTQPTLAIVRVGARPDDLAYERAALKRADKCGVAAKVVELPADCGQDRLMDAIAQVNADAGVHGCLLFRPLPAGLDDAAAASALDPAKDVDGITPGSLYGVFSGRACGFAPCTAEAVVALLDHYGVALDGAEAVVVGRSLVIGKPVAQLLLSRGATVTTCHTHTRDLAAVARRADVVVVAAGHAGTLRASELAPGQVVVDVGTNWDPAAQRLVGDVSWCADDADSLGLSAITPVPGGVGAVTTAVLVRHVVEAAERSRA